MTILNDRFDRIQARLVESFTPSICQLEDESALHAGHAGAASGGSHYRLRIISLKFENQGRIQRHRLVYDCLSDMMHKEIHALAITALAPSEI